MKFVDSAIIEVTSGNGGPGSKSFRREKYVPRGGPDGGNGGDGGSVIIKADENKHTLLDFKFKPLWKAENGQGGEGNRKNGKSGNDLIIKVPPGTEIIDTENDSVVCDLNETGQEFILAKGGRGGKGNNFFKSSTNQAPEHFQPGTPGEHKKYKLNLKVIADIGIVGFPNAGKSTFISKVSSSKPKVADYPFTTLVPNLGVVQGKGRNYVIADIPGIISGASEGKGLGFEFLKHVERCKALLFLIEPYSYNDQGEELSVTEVYQALLKELELFNSKLLSYPRIVAISKTELINDPEEQEKLANALGSEEQDVIMFSSLSGQNLDILLNEIEKLLQFNKT